VRACAAASAPRLVVRMNSSTSAFMCVRAYTSNELSPGDRHWMGARAHTAFHCIYAVSSIAREREILCGYPIAVRLRQTPLCQAATRSEGMRLERMNKPVRATFVCALPQ
jgi:hypothetical protein